jgi:hypothetical protein
MTLSMDKNDSAFDLGLISANNITTAPPASLSTDNTDSASETTSTSTNTQECNICLGQVPIANFAHLHACSHSFCRSCISTHIFTKATQSKSPFIPCPMCHVALDDHDILDLGGVDVLAQLQQQAGIAPATAQMIPLELSVEDQKLFESIARKDHFRKCPHCQSPIEKNGGCNNMSCRCGRAFQWDKAETLFPCNQVCF